MLAKASGVCLVGTDRIRLSVLRTQGDSEQDVGISCCGEAPKPQTTMQAHSVVSL